MKIRFNVTLELTEEEYPYMPLDGDTTEVVEDIASDFVEMVESWAYDSDGVRVKRVTLLS